ncbi:hypothetical protein [Nonomuraea sp. 10N515B]|uniref:hypothetical protein n=1 Tax=Nonomuraea sp. 10N515B TaxID=3457422 RepID=UPI003FCDDA27
MATIHIAGEPRFGGLYQDCARCGHVFQDYTGGEVMTLEEDAGLGIPYWTVGNRIAVNGNASWNIPDGEPLEDDETECRPTS